jgi:hypothetical protein
MLERRMQAREMTFEELDKQSTTVLMGSPKPPKFDEGLQG